MDRRTLAPADAGDADPRSQAHRVVRMAVLLQRVRTRGDVARGSNSAAGQRNLGAEPVLEGCEAGHRLDRWTKMRLRNAGWRVSRSRGRNPPSLRVPL